MRTPREADIVKTCLAVLTARGVFCWRNNTGAFAGEYNGKRRFVRFGIPGASDIIGIMPNGRFLAVECKRPGQKPTKKQYAFLAAVARQGGLATWVDDPKQLDSLFTG